MYTYSERGNLVNDGVFTYTWDVAGRLVQAENVIVTLVYTYNGDGVRVAAAVDGQEIEYVQDLVSSLSQVLIERTGTATVTYLYGLSRLAQVKGNDAEWFLGDALGSVRQIVDDDGDVVLTRDYSPYGQVVAGSGTGSSGYGFTGEQFDSSFDMIFLRARWYDVYLIRQLLEVG